VSDDFFGPPPPPPDREAHRQPEWMGPPDNEVGEVVPVTVVLARTPNLALVVRSVTAFSTGFTLSLAIRRSVAPKEHVDPFGRMYGGGHSAHGLRFGVQFSDGSKGTTYGHPGRPGGSAGAPAGPVLSQRGGSGGDRTYDLEMWVWPLPPPGPLAFVVEWPAESIPLTRNEVAAQDVLAAASRVEQLWPDPA
jgi:hypothetical protein